MSKISWEEILSLITTTGDASCSVRLLDTIFLQQDHSSSSWLWYFTTKNGIISKKKPEKSTINAITTRFHRFSMSNPYNSLQYVGTLVKDDGTRQYLTENELRNYFTTESNLIDSNSSFLQVYLRPYDGIDQIVKVSYQSHPQENFSFLVHKATGESCELNSLPESSFISDQCTIFTKEILKALRVLNFSEPLTELQMEFVIDDNKHVWLSKISQRKEIQSPDLLSSSLPELPNSSQSSRKSQGISSTPALIVATERLLWREGGIYRCKVGPEGLPGLRAWVLTSLAKQQTPSHNDWRIDFNEIANPSSTIATNDVYENRSKITRPISSKMILLIEHFQPLLCGSTEETRLPSEFTGQWKLFYNTFQKKLREKKLKTAGEVTVDGNVHAICQKLQSLIDINFEAKVASGKVC